MSVRTATLCAALALAGCPKSEKPENESHPTPSSSSSSSAPPPKVSASAASPAAAPGKATSYSGTYSLAPGKYYISESKEFSGVKPPKDDTSKLVGEGTVTIAVDAAGAVTGTIDTGPASPAVIDGRLIGTDLRGQVRRKDPSDNGLTGVLAAVASDDGATGTLSLAESTAAVVRDGKLTLKRK